MCCSEVICVDLILFVLFFSYLCCSVVICVVLYLFVLFCSYFLFCFCLYCFIVLRVVL